MSGLTRRLSAPDKLTTMANGHPAGTQAVGRALNILKLLAGTEADLPLSSIAEELGLSSGTVYRIAKALLAEGLIAQNPWNDEYYLGSGAVLLGQAAQRSFGIDKMIPFLERLNEMTEESVNLAIRDGGESVVMTRVQSTLPLRFVQRVGARFPLYATASGKVILAFSDNADEYFDSLPDRLEPVTANTLGTRDDARSAVRATRERGFSIDDQENVDGVRCVGAPVLDATGQAQAAIVIQGPTVRMDDARLITLGADAVRAAQEVSRFLPVDHPLSM
ncbi:transcriptional regulator, IclR family [Brevibacterium siliguriense]|uniref:Glycerol operon regulatory protein n=2 Tax=Brevibacterium siliguriense TaxID=1136497 RepID=A0A1H1SS16_9MICO|nr:transcriptional regulator, IclR family [Brevibacterium siliguriense]